MKSHRWTIVLGVIAFLVVATMVWASPPPSAPSVPPLATPRLDADKVDGHHAASSKAPANQRKNKVLWATKSGRLHWKSMPVTQLNNRYVNEKGALNTDIPVQGTGWVAQSPATLSHWVPLGWGTDVKRIALGGEWFHIPIPAPSFMFGNWSDVTYIQFCYKTSNTATYVDWMDIWSDQTQVVHKALSAPSDTGFHCYSHSFSPPKWFAAVGLSIHGTFANSAHQLTLGKAWVRLKLR